MPSSEHYALVQRFYVGFYGRPADVVGLDYWASQLEANNGDLSAILNSFASSPEAQAFVYKDATGNLNTTQQLIANVYRTVYNREPEELGLNYWSNRLNPNDLTLQTIVQTIMDGALGEDKVTLNNKILVANYFTDIISSTPYTDVMAGRSVVAKAGQTTVSYNLAVQAADDTVASMQSANAGKVFTGTEGNDTFSGSYGNACDTFYGLGGEDTFHYYANEAAPGESLNKTSGHAIIRVHGNTDFSKVQFNLPSTTPGQNGTRVNQDHDMYLDSGAVIRFNPAPFADKDYDMNVHRNLEGSNRTIQFYGTSGNDTFNLRHCVVGEDVMGTDKILVSGNGGSDTFDASQESGGFKYDCANLITTQTVSQDGKPMSSTFFSFSDSLVNFYGGAGGNEFIASARKELFRGGAGRDTFQFDSTASSSTSTAVAMDTVESFQTSSDKLSFGSASVTQSGQQSLVQAAVTGLSASATPTEIANAMAAANTTNNGVSYAVVGGATYVYLEKNGAGAGNSTNDVFVKLNTAISSYTDLGLNSATADPAFKLLRMDTTKAANGETSADSNIVLKFDRPVTAGSGNIVLHNYTKNGNVALDVTNTSFVTFSGDTITINPESNLSNGCEFGVEIGAGVIKDTSGGNFAGIIDKAQTFNTASVMMNPAPGHGTSQSVGNYYSSYYGLHPAQDFIHDGGLPVYACADGVLEIYIDKGADQKYSILKFTSDNKYLDAVYLHVVTLPGLVAGSQTQVSAGQELGTIYTMAGDHLHFELRTGNATPTSSSFYGHDNSNGYYTDLTNVDRYTSPEVGKWSRNEAYKNMYEDNILIDKTAKNGVDTYTPIQPTDYIAERASSSSSIAGDSRATALDLGKITDIGQKITRYDWVGKDVDASDFYKIHVDKAGTLSIALTDSVAGGLSANIMDSTGKELSKIISVDKNLSSEVKADTDYYVSIVGTDYGSQYSMIATLL